MNCNTEYLYTSGSAWVHFEPVVSKRTQQIRWNCINIPDSCRMRQFFCSVPLNISIFLIVTGCYSSFLYSVDEVTATDDSVPEVFS